MDYRCRAAGDQRRARKRITDLMRFAAAAMATIGLFSSSALSASPGAGVELYVESGIRHSARSVAFSADGRLLATGSLDRTVKIWDAATGRELATLDSGTKAVSLAFLPQQTLGAGTLALLGEDGVIQLWDVTSAQRLERTIACTEHSNGSLGVHLASSELRCADPSSSRVRRFDLATLDEHLPSFMVPGLEAGGRLRSDGSVVAIFGAVGTAILNLDTGSTPSAAPAEWGQLESFAAAPRTGQVAIINDSEGRVQLWDGSSGTLLFEARFDGVIAHDAAFNPDGSRLAIAGENGDVVVIDPTKPGTPRTALVTLRSYANRIEAAGLAKDSSLLAVHVWYDRQIYFDLRRGGMVSDVSNPRLTYGTIDMFANDGTRYGEPFTVSAKNDRVEIRGRDDVLLATLLVLDKIGGWVVIDPHGRFDTNMALDDIKGVHWSPSGKPLEALPLDLLIRDYFHPRLLPRLLAAAPLGTPPRLETLDRRVPRVQIISTQNTSQGQVRVSLQVDDGPPDARSAAHDLRLFRDGRLVKRWTNPTASGEPASLTFETTIPCATTPNRVRFTAYAFNGDRVKSQTASAHHDTPQCPPAQPVAYVITIGVNASQDPKWTLNYAVNDSRVMASSLSRISGYRVVSVRLESVGKEWVDGRATKASIREVLARLAGSSVVPSALEDIEGAANLAKATPDDVVIFFFAGHGVTDRRGEFYLLPSDVGPTVSFRADSLARLISSQELSSWLEPINAGQMVLILDACRSTTSVEQPGFKPAPIGGGGLGQTAYDKAMWVLAAGYTSAFESPRLEHGYMSYALGVDGLSADGSGRLAADNNGDGRLTLAEWLDFGVRRTPELTTGEPHAQTPTLFDFAREPGREIVLRQQGVPHR